MKTSSNNNNIESNKVQLDDPKGKVNRVYNAIVAAIKGDRMIGRHIAQTYGTNGPRPVYGIEVWESIVYVHTDTDRRIFDKAIDRLLKAHEDLFKWADFKKASEEGPYIVLALTDEAVKAKKEEEKAIREAEKKRKERETATLEPASEITESLTAQDFADALEIREGDRVLSKHFQTMGTVTGIYEWNGGTCYDVTLDKAVRGFSGETITKTAFRRYGITKNYYPHGTAEIVCNALYYAEQLKYGPGSIHEYEFAGVALRTESTREDVEPDSREGWGNEYRVTIHHKTGGTTETMTLSETAELLARMYQEEQGKTA